MHLSLSIGVIALSLSLSWEDWLVIIVGTALSYAIVIFVYYIQKKESAKHKQDHDMKLDELRELHQQDSEKIRVLYELILQSQSGSIGEVEAEALEKKIDAAADDIGVSDSNQAQALKAIADKQKDEADNLLAKIAQQEHDLEELYNLHAINEYRNGNYAEAATWLKKLTDLKPENWDYHIRYSVSLSGGGFFKEGEEHSLSVLQKLQSKPVPDEKLISTWLHTTGLVKSQQGKIKEGEDYYYRALEMGIKAYGNDHPELANTYNDIGCAKMNRGELEEAAEYIRTALRIKDNNNDQELINTAYMKWNLASIYQGQNKLAETEKLLLEGKQAIEETLGDDHPALTYCYTKLGQLYRVFNKYEEALDFTVKAIEIFEKKHLTNHPMYPFSLNLLGLLHCLAGRYEQAIEILTKASDLSLELSGENNTTYTSSQYWMAICLSGLCKNEEAENLMLKAIQMESNLPAISRHSHGKSFLQLGIIQIKMHKYEQAEQNLNTSIDLMLQQLDAEHTDVLTCKYNLAKVYQKTERLTEAEKILLEILPVLEKAYPPTEVYKDALDCMLDNYCRQGKTDDAEEYAAKYRDLTEKQEST